MTEEAKKEGETNYTQAQTMSVENRTSSRAIENPHQPNPSSIFGTVTANLPSQVPYR